MKPVRHFTHYAISGVFVFLFTAPSAAQTPTEIDDLRAQIIALQKRLDRLEAAQKTQKVETGKSQTFAVTSKTPVTISGTLQVHGTAFFRQSAHQVAYTFRLRRGDLRLTAQITPKIIGTIEIDPAKQLTINAAGAVTQSTNILQDINLQYRLKKAARSAHFLDIGQFKIPIGYESDLLTLSNLPLIERALMYTERDPFGGGYGDIRDTGMQLRGTCGPIDYRFGVFNGFGERQNTVAQSDAKAVMGRLIYAPPALPGLKIGFSGARGDTNTPNIDRKLWNAFAAYQHKNLSVQGEFLRGDELGMMNGAPTQRNIESYYLSGAYRCAPRLEGVLRYDYFDTDRALPGADGSDLTLGVNYYIKGTSAKIQTNLVRRNGDSAAHTATGWGDLRQDRYELRTNFQVGF